MSTSDGLAGMITFLFVLLFGIASGYIIFGIGGSAGTFAKGVLTGMFGLLCLVFFFNSIYDDNG